MKKGFLKKSIMSLVLGVSVCLSSLSPVSVFAASKDKTPPVIYDVKITDKDPSGFTVYCKVKDNSGKVDKVLVPVWTKKNSQDDLVWGEASLKNGVATYRVKISDHNWEVSNYICHIYAYDSAGNVSGNSSLGKQNVNAPDFSKVIAKYANNSTFTGSYKGATQCHGFALTIGKLMSGVDPLTKWSTSKSLSKLKAGDIVRFKHPHTIVVMSVSGSTVTYVDANWTGKNRVTYYQTINKSQLTKKFGQLEKVFVYPN
jgi:hypothetical protein